MVKAHREGFPRQHRIVRGSEYRAIYRIGVKLNSDRLVLFGRENNLKHSRLGITVSRKVGGAVIRNRVKRLFREIFRKSVADIPNHFDLVVNAKRACAGACYSDLGAEFIFAAQKLCRRPGQN